MVETILNLIIKYGIPMAEKIYTTISTHGQPTAAMWADLKKLNEEWTLDKYIEEAKAKLPTPPATPPV